MTDPPSNTRIQDPIILYIVLTIHENLEHTLFAGLVMSVVYKMFLRDLSLFQYSRKRTRRCG